MSKRQVEQLTSQLARHQDDSQRHILAMQAEINRLQTYTTPQLANLLQTFPELADVIAAVQTVALARHNLTSTPIQQTGTTSHNKPDSTPDHTRTGRKARNYNPGPRLARAADLILNDLEDQPTEEARDNRDYSAHVRHHVNQNVTRTECRWCTTD